MRVESVGSEGFNRHSRAAEQGRGSRMGLEGSWDGGWQDRSGDTREATAKPGNDCFPVEVRTCSPFCTYAT